jgi:hypothetical protein
LRKKTISNSVFISEVWDQFKELEKTNAIMMLGTLLNFPNFLIQIFVELKPHLSGLITGFFYGKFYDLKYKKNILSETHLNFLGLDLAPHYFMFLKNYIAKFPDTQLGQPGKFQVVCLRLKFSKI